MFKCKILNIYNCVIINAEIATGGARLKKVF